MADKPFNKIPLTNGDTGVVHPHGVDIEEKNTFITTHPVFDIPNKADLNTSDYLVVGTYQSGSGSNTFTNSPLNGAWEMFVLCPIGTNASYSVQNKATIDKTRWVYRVRILMAYNSPTIYYQSVSSGSQVGVYTYSAWTKMATVNDNVAAAAKLAIPRKINGVAFDGSADIVSTAGDYSSNTLENLINKLQLTTGGKVGSANIMKDTRIKACWYNFLWMPHRVGYISNSNNDNKDWGTLLLFGMATDLPSYKVRTSKNGAVASIISYVTSETKFQTNLGSTTAGSFDGSANVEPGVKGTLPVANGGTGATDAAGARKNLGLVDATQSTSGLMSASDKKTLDNTKDKLDSLAALTQEFNNLREYAFVMESYNTANEDLTTISGLSAAFTNLRTHMFVPESA